jgi:hypothetical protein
MSKGRLFHTDDGKHPPPLDRYFAGWGGLRKYRSGGVRFPVFPIRREVLGANARWWGRYFVVIGLGTPAVVGLLTYAGKVHLDSAAVVALVIVCAPLLALGVNLLRASRTR